MTLIVGAHLGDGVGVLGDTRLSVTHRKTRRTTYYDDCQEIYSFPSVLVGVAGDLRSASRFLLRFYQQHLMDQPKEEALYRSSERDVLSDLLCFEYDRAVWDGQIEPERRF